MRDNDIWLVIAVPILAGSLFYILKNWRAEFRFYASHNWDYSVDNPDAIQAYWSEDSPQTEENRMSNRQRMNFGYPFATFAITSILCGFLFITFKIYTCNFDDLKKCGITEEGGSVTFMSP